MFPCFPCAVCHCSGSNLGFGKQQLHTFSIEISKKTGQKLHDQMKTTPINRLPVTVAAALGFILSGGSISAASYESSVLADEPLFYLPMTLPPLPESVAKNQGTASTLAPDGSHLSVDYGTFGAISSAASNRAVTYQGSSRTVVPYSATVNPAANQSFTVEAWVYSTSTDLSGDPSPVFNRETLPGGNFRGWAFHQSQGEFAQMEFRMYNGTGTNPAVILTGIAETPQWNHVVATWDAGTQTATLYINGAEASSMAGISYQPNQSGPLSLGGAPDALANSFEGSVDEVAFYPTRLTAEEISSHFSNGVGIELTSVYTSLVSDKSPSLYLRLEEFSPSLAVAENLGSLGEGADGIHTPGLKHQVPGAIRASEDTAAGYHLIVKENSDGGYPTILPFDPELNTSEFSVEAWLRPTIAGNQNAQCPLYNYDPAQMKRSGWVLWQRAPSAGWNFRAYNEVDANSSARDAVNATFGPYTPGEWQHVVITFSGNQAIFYINGQQAGSANVNGVYNPNRAVGNGRTIRPAIGGFPTGWENGFEGDIDEVAYYNTVLTPAQVAAHHANGISENPAIPYETLILSDEPVGYYRLNEGAVSVAENLGTLGDAANATFENINKTAPAPATGGFAATDKGAVFDGTRTYVELTNPPGLNFTGEITLEAWVQPDADALLNNSRNILAHGHAAAVPGVPGVLEVYLRIEAGNYQVGNTNDRASFPIPAEDLTGTAWVHLAGTWDGTKWTLYRNGVNVAEKEEAAGAILVDTANWAVGARGRSQRATGYPEQPLLDPRIFSGGILGAAIYNKSLPAERILAHYNSQLAMMNIQIERPAGVITLTWDGGVLQESDDLIEWQDVTVTGGGPAVSPYQPNDGPRHFYRVREVD